jgi:NADPH2:quinone reductase
MRAVCQTAKGWGVAEHAPPLMGPQEVRVRVRAAGLNRADVLQSRGLYPAPPGAPADILGLEFAGEVVELGTQVQGIQSGQHVMGLVGGGAFAQEVVVHARELLPLPKGMRFTDAAAIPEAFITAYDALVLQGELRPNEWVLIHAAGSGVGSAGVVLAQAFGAHAIGTTRSDAKLKRCEKELGLRRGILCAEGPVFASEVRTLTGGKGAALALELVSGDYLPQTLDAMATRGRIIVVGMLGGTSSPLSVGTLMQRRVRMQGTVLRSRPLEEKIAVARRFRAEVLPFFERGVLRPLVDQVYPMEQFAAAMERMTSNETFGKCVLTWDGDNA